MPLLKMRKGETKAQQIMRTAMTEFQKGTLRSGSGKRVKMRKQAIAIGMAQARRV